jgi:hypothetical protein
MQNNGATIGEAAIYRRYAVSFILIAVLFFAVLQLRAPYYFLQDDNRDIALPLFVHGWRALAQFSIAQYNYHQFLGAPVQFQDYPPAMAAVAASRALSGHYWAAMDILAFLHICVAGLGAFACAAAMGLGAMPAFFAAVVWGVNPFAILCGVSWWSVQAAAAWFPWLVFGLLKLYSGGEKTGFFALASSMGMFALACHPQYQVYSSLILLLLGLLLVLIVNDSSELSLANIGSAFYAKRRFLFLLVAAVVCGWLIGGVCMLPVYAASLHNHYRSGAVNYADFSLYDVRIGDWFKGILWPYGGPRAAAPNLDDMDRLAHLGYLVPMLAVFAFMRRARDFAKAHKAQLAAFAALGAFCLCWSFGWFDRLEYMAPVLNRFRWHFRILLFADFFICMIATLGFAAFAETFARRLAAAVFALLVVNFFAYYSFGPRLAFRHHADAIPHYEPLAARLSGGRTLACGFADAPQLMPALGFDYSTLFKLYNFSGYDVVLPLENMRKTLGINYEATLDAPPDAARLGHFEVWGVRYYIVAPALSAAFSAATGMPAVFADSSRIIFEDKKALPLVFRDGENIPAASVAPSGNVLNITPQIPGGCYNVNWLYNANMKLLAEGGNAAMSQNPVGQIRVCTDAGVKSFSIIYRDPALAYGMTATLCGLAGALLAAVLL